jgi:hypothetical protein
MPEPNMAIREIIPRHRTFIRTDANIEMVMVGQGPPYAADPLYVDTATLDDFTLRSRLS